MRTTSVALELLLLLPAPTLGSEGEVQRVLLAGDIASCDWTADTVTGHLGAARDGVVMTVGDPVYQLGTTSQFQDFYEPTWGRVRDRTSLELQLSAGGYTWPSGRVGLISGSRH